MSKHRRRRQAPPRHRIPRYEPAWDPDWTNPEPAAPHVPDNWQEAWAPTTLAVCERVWHATAHKLYPANGLLRDDLWGWLWEHACQFANNWEPRHVPDAEDRWAATLYKALRANARWHWAEASGSVYQDKHGVRHSVVVNSIDALLDRARETKQPAEKFMSVAWAHPEPAPEQHVIRCEELTAALHYAEKSSGTTYSTTTPTTCSEPLCSRSPATRGLCPSHYSRWYRWWLAGTCAAEGCTRTVATAGLCGSHYDASRADRSIPCAEADCTRPARARGLCHKHYDHARRHQNLPPTTNADNSGPCAEADCTRPARARGLCHKHYKRAWKAEKKAGVSA